MALRDGKRLIFEEHSALVVATFRGMSSAHHSGAHLPTGASQLAGHVARWLLADPRDVLTFAHRAAPAPHPPPPSPSRGEGEHGISPLPRTGRGAGGEGLDLHAGLSAWQDIMARWRLVAVLRRWAIVALALVLLLAVPGRLSTSLPAWI